jgi:hypothetical protein
MRLLGGNGRAPGPSGALSRVDIPTSVSKGAKKVRRQQRRMVRGRECRLAPAAGTPALVVRNGT